MAESRNCLGTSIGYACMLESLVCRKSVSVNVVDVLATKLLLLKTLSVVDGLSHSDAHGLECGKTFLADFSWLDKVCVEVGEGLILDADMVRRLLHF